MRYDCGWISVPSWTHFRLYSDSLWARQTDGGKTSACEWEWDLSITIYYARDKANELDRRSRRRRKTQRLRLTDCIWLPSTRWRAITVTLLVLVVGSVISATVDWHSSVTLTGARHDSFNPHRYCTICRNEQRRNYIRPITSLAVKSHRDGSSEDALKPKIRRKTEDNAKPGLTAFYCLKPGIPIGSVPWSSKPPKGLVSSK